MGAPFSPVMLGDLDLFCEPSLVVQADLQRSVVIRFGFPIWGAFALETPRFGARSSGFSSELPSRVSARNICPGRHEIVGQGRLFTVPLPRVIDRRLSLRPSIPTHEKSPIHRHPVFERLSP